MSVSDEQASDHISLPESVEGFTKRRVELVQRAVKEWTGALIDLGGRNNLLHYRDLKAGTLDLTGASPRALGALLQGKTIKTSTLFSDVEGRERNVRRLRTIANKAKENFEERGLETLSLACGLATWNNENVAAWEPSAPVLLRQASLRSLGAAQDDFELALVDEMEVNPTLLHFLKVNFDCGFDQEKLLDRVEGVIDQPWELQAAYDWMIEHTRRVPGFGIEPRLVLANFAYAKLPMVRDLESAFDELVASDLIAAIAGDEDARAAVRAAGPGPDAVPSVDAMPLADEFLVLDADSSQNWAINAVLGGESLIVRGPPGTGKSQTISNLISSLIARNKRVLFVAEKRAAIDAVLKRLHSEKLGDLVLDLHGGVGSRRAFAQAIGGALASSRTAPRVNREAEQRRVEKRRGELNEYVAALHEQRPPWGLSVYDLRTGLLALRGYETDLRFHDNLDRLDGTAIEALEEEVSQYARRDGFTLGSSARPWARAAVVSQEEAQQANALVEELRRHRLPQTWEALSHAAAQVHLPAAGSVVAWEERLDLWREIQSTLEHCEPSIYDEDLGSLVGRMGPAADSRLARIRASLTSADYKQARAQLRGSMREGKTRDAVLLSRAEAAADQKQRWVELGGEGAPSAPANLAALDAGYSELLTDLERLREVTQSADDRLATSNDDLRAELDRLAADRGTLMTIPELRRIEAGFRASGLDEFIDEMRTKAVSEDAAIATFRFVWLQSILDRLAISDRLVEGFVPEQHERTIDDFRTGDREHIQTTAARIRRICAEQAVKARDEFRDQAEIVQHQAGLKTRHMPVRDLVRNTADVLLALKPCWAMSPLVVSQLLPAKNYFDVVIFDEASQVTPADAATSILRGDQLVIAGDEKQLPPTAFFVSDSPEEDDDETLESSVVGGTKGFESILDALGSLLRFRMLRWHYRSRDERLIAFSNAHIYDRQLVTFPGVGGHQVLTYVPVGHDPTADTNSPSPEVDAVVELIFEHARERPTESLGVIAMGIKHANRIDECRLQRLHEDPALEEELREFFTEDREERFFVKNLERVQGDERDAIILSIGYGKSSRGDLPYRFGPLLSQGGERRLNVAVTRAKNRLTLVSSFGARDMDPERSPAAGVQLLRQYLQYVESEGKNLGDAVFDKPALNPFEVDVRDTLTRAGLKLVAQYGSSGYWIDYVVAHPTQPGRHVLAIECDGASYHSSESARDRDRLRQEQLERLGWRFHRIWSGEWFYNKDKCVEKVMAAYRDAVTAADREDDAATNGGAEAPDSRRIRDRVKDAWDDEPERTRRRSGPRPPLRRGQPIEHYTQSQLVRLIRWIESDDLIRTEQELLDETVRELGFQKRGKNIVAAVKDAIRGARGDG